MINETNENVKKQSNKYKVMLLIAIAAIVLFRVIRYASAMGLNLDEAMGVQFMVSSPLWC